jgi:hypothetical protein
VNQTWMTCLISNCFLFLELFYKILSKKTINNKKMATELPCYTILHLPQDGEQPSEMKLKEDLEKGDNKVISKKKKI